MRILVTGSKGQLGNELQKLAEQRGELDWSFVDVDELDITDLSAARTFFRSYVPDICINCAAYTAVDKAEAESETARLVNVTGAENLAAACEETGTSFVHVSTDFVFSGTADKPYTTDHPVEPLSVYGLTKAEGEYRVLSSCAKTWLIRTSWVYSAFGGNFVKTMIRLGKERTELGVVNDQTGSPTWAHDLAAAIMTIVDHRDEVAFGIYHYSNKGAITWFDFATAIMEEYGLDCRVHPITTADYPTPAKRPVYSVLDLSGTESIPGIRIPDWKESLKHCLLEIKKTENA